MKTLKLILAELVEIRKALQTIASSSECNIQNKLEIPMQHLRNTKPLNYPR